MSVHLSSIFLSIADLVSLSVTVFQMMMIV